jgi:GT2 family glycosyltransferase
MESHPQVGIAGSQLENADGGLDSSAHIFPSPLSELDAGARLGVLSRFLYRYAVTSAPQNLSHVCDWVSGASMMIRRQVIEDIGWMDEKFFLYFEEVDYCRRARQAGWECWYVPDSRVVHLEGASTGIRASSKRRARYWYDSRRRFFVKHYGITGLVAADMLRVIGQLSFVLRKSLHLCSIVKQILQNGLCSICFGDMFAVLTGQCGAFPSVDRHERQLSLLGAMRRETASLS